MHKKTFWNSFTRFQHDIRYTYKYRMYLTIGGCIVPSCPHPSYSQKTSEFNRLPHKGLVFVPSLCPLIKTARWAIAAPSSVLIIWVFMQLAEEALPQPCNACISPFLWKFGSVAQSIQLHINRRPVTKTYLPQCHLPWRTKLTLLDVWILSLWCLYI